MNYKSLLANIQNAPSENIDTIIVPSNKQLYEIDLNTRQVTAPETLSIQTEHYAETVYFICDRFYDSMDLAQTNCVVQYTIGEHSYVYAVPYCDITSREGKMIIPWTVSISATEEAGTIKFLIRFYLISQTSLYDDNNNYTPENAEFSYSLSTLPATSQILKSFPQKEFVEEDAIYELPERYFELIDFVNQQVDNATVYWIDADKGEV